MLEVNMFVFQKRYGIYYDKENKRSISYDLVADEKWNYKQIFERICKRFLNPKTNMVEFNWASFKSDDFVVEPVKFNAKEIENVMKQENDFYANIYYDEYNRYNFNGKGFMGKWLIDQMLSSIVWNENVLKALKPLEKKFKENDVLNVIYNCEYVVNGKHTTQTNKNDTLSLKTFEDKRKSIYFVCMNLDVLLDFFNFDYAIEKNKPLVKDVEYASE